MIGRVRNIVVRFPQEAAKIVISGVASCIGTVVIENRFDIVSEGGRYGITIKGTEWSNSLLFLTAGKPEYHQREDK